MKIKDKNKSKLKKLYITAFLLIISIFTFIYLNNTPYISNYKKMIMPQNKKVETYMENGNESSNIEVLDRKKEKDTLKNSDLLRDLNILEENQNPNTILINNKKYYLFDGSILLPLENVSWNQFDIKTDDLENSYSGISEYIPLNESRDNWTQKLTIHKINIDNKDSFLFVDKLVNGLILNVSNQMELNNKEMNKENISFNYAKKDVNDTLMYWTLFNTGFSDDEVQFVRVFISKYSQNMYLVTFTLKTNPTTINLDDINNMFKSLDSIQELKKK